MEKNYVLGENFFNFLDFFQITLLNELFLIYNNTIFKKILQKL